MKLRYSLVIVFALVAGLAGGALWSWILFMTGSSGAANTDIEKIKLYVQIASVIVLVVSIGISSYFVKRQMAETQEWNKRKATRDMVSHLAERFDRHELNMREVGVNFSKGGQTYDTVVNMDKSSESKIWDDLSPLLMELEQLAWGIKHNIYDGDLAYDLYRLILQQVYEWAEPAIDKVRQVPDGKRAYIELQKLHEIWKVPSRKERREKLLAYQAESKSDLPIREG